METFFQNKNFQKLSIALLSVLSLFVAAKFLTELKNYQYVGNQYPPQNVISLSGHGEAFAVPDIAEITFAVHQEAKDVATAQKKVTDSMNAIIDSLKKAGIAEKDIQTTGYDISPMYEYQTQAIVCAPGMYCPQPGKQVLTGYGVTHNITLKVRKTDEAGKILSSLGTLGATNLSGINFTIDNQDAVKDSARTKAIADAKDKADALAKQLGVRLVRIVNFSENGNYPVYYATKTMSADSMGGMSAPASAPQIPTGENKVTSDVTISYEIR